MRRSLRPTITLLALATTLGTVAACSGADDPGSAGETETASPSEEMTPSDDAAEDDMGAVVLTTADSELGEIVVDGEGMTVYYYTSDVPDSGESTCEGDCLAAWPPVHADSEDPQVEGVTAEVGTITGNDGELQVTIDGRPVYLYQGDAAPGDVTGQAVDDVWWAVAPDGSEITETGAGGGY
jgi:predicted lipoprotein with Yx(FWY)xxD motif